MEGKVLDPDILNIAVASNEISSCLARDEVVELMVLRSQVQSCSQVPTPDVQITQSPP